MKSHGEHHGLIEWAVVKMGRRGVEARHSEGAQVVFGLQRAKKIAKELGPPWEIRHYQDFTKVPPAEE